MNGSELSQGLSGFSGDYVRFVRPTLGKALRGIKLDLEYFDGKKDTLFAKSGNEQFAVLDLTGGYGANLLGHKNPHILKHATGALLNGPPSHLQGSIRKSTASLAKKLSERLQEEVGSSHWFTHFSNSGTEAVEAAIKHSAYHFDRRLERMQQNLNENRNSLVCLVRSSSFGRQHHRMLEASLNELESFLFGKVSHGGLEVRIQKIFEYQSERLKNMKPCLGGLEGSFHGKTLGALQVMGHPVHLENLRGLDKVAPFHRDIPTFNNELLDYIETLKVVDPKSLKIQELTFLKLSAFFVEPILGEGGIVEISKQLLLRIREVCTEFQVLMVSDEIQAGLYRTGYMASLSRHKISADVYLFSKGLGGGVAKIGATMINDREYTEIMGVRHSSTFAEDHFSSSVAEKVIDTLQPHLVRTSMDIGRQLKSGLEGLKQQFPNFIREVRGQGLLLGIDLNLESFRDLFRDFQWFYEQGILTYGLSAVLLHREKLRISPSLSNLSTWRIEPSLYFTSSEVKNVLSGLSRFFRAAENKKTDYFFNQKNVLSMFSVKQAGPQSSTTMSTDVDAVFFSHLIDAQHAQQLFGSMATYSLNQVAHTVYDLSSMQGYIPSYEGVLYGKNHKQIRYVFMSLPYTTKEFEQALTSGKRDHIITKIQQAMVTCKEMGAKTVGLGQFNSIVSGNGLRLDNLGMNLTTGNAYTVYLTYLAVKQEISRRGLPPEDINICCVGAAGNIMAMVARLLAPHCRKMSLINRTSAQRSPQFRQSIVEVLKAMRNSTSENNKALREHLEALPSLDQDHVLEIVKSPVVRDFLTLSDKLEDARQSNIVVCGTSSARPILGKKHIGKGALVIDISVPSNIKDEVHSIPGVDIIGGGQALLPSYSGSPQSIQVPGFPLSEGLAYACMAETFSIALSEKSNVLHIGEVDINMVNAIAKMADDAGMQLGRISRITNSLQQTDSIDFKAQPLKKVR